MKKFLAIALSAIMLLTAAGCGGTEQSEQTSDATSGNSSMTQSDNSSDSTASGDNEVTSASDTEEPSVPDQDDVIDYSKLTDEEIYDLMVQRSLMTTGDMTRMANVLDRAAKGEEITVAYIGGSITEGYHDNLLLQEDEKWAKMSLNWLAEQYPDAKFNYVNAGLSGTPSVLGNVRLDRDVLASEPDVVFVEFAVNDGMESEYKNAYESLVRTLLSQEQEIAVVLVFTIIESGHTCQEYMSKIGENYGLPMISLPDSLWVEIQEGRMVWDDYSGDQSHPHVEGSVMLSDFVINYYEQVIAQAADNVGEVDTALPEPVFSDDYMNMHFVDSKNFEPETENFNVYATHAWFNDGWLYKGKNGASMKFTVDCAKLALVFKASNSETYADAEVYVDGELLTTVSSNMADGWGNPVAKYVIDESESAQREVEIVIPASEKASCFFMLGLGYCE